MFAAFLESLLKYLILGQFLETVSTKKWLNFDIPERIYLDSIVPVRVIIWGGIYLFRWKGYYSKLFKLSCGIVFEAQHNLLQSLHACKYLSLKDNFDDFGTKVIHTKVWWPWWMIGLGRNIICLKLGKSINQEVGHSHGKEEPRDTVYSLRTEAERESWPYHNHLSVQLLKDTMVLNFRERAS